MSTPLASINIPNIEALMRQGFCLQSWSGRYGNGIWLCLAPGEGSTDAFRDLTSAGDLDALPTAEYALSANWLPIVAKNTLCDAMLELEARLASLPESVLKINSYWALAVMDALEHVGEVERSKPGYGLEGHFAILPREFVDLDPKQRLNLSPK